MRYEEAAHAWDWQVGLHGVILAFKCPNGSGRRYSATYLPEVAREQRECVCDGSGARSVGAARS